MTGPARRRATHGGQLWPPAPTFSATGMLLRIQDNTWGRALRRSRRLRSRSDASISGWRYSASTPSRARALTSARLMPTNGERPNHACSMVSAQPSTPVAATHAAVSQGSSTSAAAPAAPGRRYNANCVSHHAPSAPSAEPPLGGTQSTQRAGSSGSAAGRLSVSGLTMKDGKPRASSTRRQRAVARPTCSCTRVHCFRVACIDRPAAVEQGPPGGRAGQDVCGQGCAPTPAD